MVGHFQPSDSCRYICNHQTRYRLSPFLESINSVKPSLFKILDRWSLVPIPANIFNDIAGQVSEPLVQNEVQDFDLSLGVMTRMIYCVIFHDRPQESVVASRKPCRRFRQFDIWVAIAFFTIEYRAPIIVKNRNMVDPVPDQLGCLGHQFKCFFDVVHFLSFREPASAPDRTAGLRRQSASSEHPTKKYRVKSAPLRHNSGYKWAPIRKSAFFICWRCWWLFGTLVNKWSLIFLICWHCCLCART